MGNLKSKILKRDKERQNAKNKGKELVEAAANGRLSDLDIIVQDEEYKDAVCGKDGFTALLLASSKGYADCVLHLLQAGVNFRYNAEWSDNTPMIMAAEQGHEVCLQMLVQAGADVNEGNKTGQMPLHQAVTAGALECAEILLSNGADLNSRDAKGEMALHIAARNDFDQIVELLIDHYGADINAQDKDGATPLHAACDAGGYECVELLLHHKAKYGIVDNNGTTPLFRALEAGKISIAFLLMKEIFDVELPNGLQVCENPFGVLFHIIEHVLKTQFSDELHVILNHLLFYHEIDPESLRCIIVPVIKSIDVTALNHFYSDSWPKIFCSLVINRFFFIIKTLTVAGQEWLGQEMHFLQSNSPGLYRWVLAHQEGIPSLQHLTRLHIRRQLGCNIGFGVTKLPLEQHLRDYIMLKECDMF
ncbi:serine/threonine-protein phosphatase 6 regulatory ankyrin repeat subunit A-like [Lingula anatina]|uniref:Serine/threonine-protein phosphatase 6 regulatory ankyrin repeat subunit A-like n=1 Tax=Lingula anatina TaxID=7574 RepID=A0A1S3KA52_LINAN|nr:serine/threonine-protein phosphatase 6 regulatory ankyrin repeat subunit A-like [Lingula anatina]|eukprot:XP_013419126.1 serine/threonine-protein phosphatase 6 regulatory ankyrin repeat subunit A-like [Lingula anatina]